MTTHSQWEACRVLEHEGLHQVALPGQGPMGGLILFTDQRHRQLLEVNSDGRVVDLRAVCLAAEDVVNDMPRFDNDDEFGRLLKNLAEVVNGRNSRSLARKIPPRC